MNARAWRPLAEGSRRAAFVGRGRQYVPIARFEATGSPVITDGEQRKYHNFLTYCVHGLPNTAPDGFKIPFAAGHVRRIPRLTGGPFRYRRYADAYMDVAHAYAHVPVKQAVISPSALSLMYPADGLPGYAREQFIDDLLHEHETEIRRCLKKGAYQVQIDFTEARLAMKLDPFRRAPQQLHRSQQPRARAIFGRGPQAHRRAHVSGRRPRLDAQRRCRLRGAPAESLRNEGGQLLSKPVEVSELIATVATIAGRTGEPTGTDRSNSRN
jgi:hypothetical protein